MQQYVGDTFGGGRSKCRERGGRFGNDVEDDEWGAFAYEVRRERPPHVAEANESNIHYVSIAPATGSGNCAALEEIDQQRREPRCHDLTT